MGVRFYLVARGGRTYYRVRASDLIINLPELFSRGLIKAVETNSRWDTNRAGECYFFKVYMYKWQLYDWIREKRIKRIWGDDEVDNSINYNYGLTAINEDQTNVKIYI
jgi:hypothetical protein